MTPKLNWPNRFSRMIGDTKGWIDPFRLLHVEDPDGTQIASILCQAAIPSIYAGAALVTANDRLRTEGKAGEGATFMKGTSRPEKLPDEVHRQVEALHRRASNLLGPVRFEWVFDGTVVWVLQLHRGATQSTASLIVPGEADRWIPFAVERGLEQLRQTMTLLDPVRAFFCWAKSALPATSLM